MSRAAAVAVAAALVVAGLLLWSGMGGDSGPPPPAPGAGGGLRVLALDGMTRVPRRGGFQGAGEVRLYAARNETEPFQIVVAAGGRGVEVRDLVVSELAGPAGATISGAVRYREHYVTVSTPSPLSQYPPGEYPDALIPFQDPAGGAPLGAARYAALPVRVAAGENQPFWIDLHVPRQAPAGEYRGQVQVIFADRGRVTLPLLLTVWDFTLPEVPALGSDFVLNRSRVAEIYGLCGERDAARLNRLTRSYYDLLLDHLLAPARLYDAAPSADPESGAPDFGVVYAGLGSAAQGLEYYLNRKHASSYGYLFWDDSPFADPLGRDRARMKRFLSGYARHLERHGWSGRAHMPYGFLDEPSSREAYARVRAWGELFNELEEELGIPLPMMVTEQPDPEQPEWGSLQGFVDIWVPEFNQIWRDQYRGAGSLRRQLERGDRIWSYAALAYLPAGWRLAHPFTTRLKESHPPKWLLDFAPINYRIPAWLNALAGISGLLYWDTLWWDEGVDVWQEGGNYRHEDPDYPEASGTVFNGEGFLIYPGFRDRVGFDGPVPSMRLKWLREAVEDYAYIQLLREAGEWQFARRRIHGFARGVDDWRDDVAALYRARRAMGERLSALHGEQQVDAALVSRFALQDPVAVDLVAGAQDVAPFGESD
ncbi:MAG TPA: DUF4091 domain-containing protein [Gammaproteobacteria bacterium]|nr:DUF4091 domain-containing protein [Gammaproteobacteria bacterium]